METSGFPDWSKIGRRIGKRLKDILDPPRDTGPSKEERREQRLRDVAKGFAYFDTFDELFNWTSKDVEPVQQANTPLLQRSAAAVYGQGQQSANLILCHDYHGGYHDYESVRPELLQEEPYSCHYLQYADTFIYFSHKLVCCPPPTWINLLHRNGVKVLGTFIVEPQSQDIERMLEYVNGEYIVAKQLAAMADTLGFDGWLLNIENEFPGHVHDPTSKLCGFIEDLKRHLGPDKLVIWYDALNTDNEVEYQNGLSPKNAIFARATKLLLTNYKWTTRDLRNSKAVAKASNVDCSAVSFGIDVWAQNTNMPGPARVTYPVKGGGGTNTGLAVKALAQTDFSATIFAPAWTYEHFSTSSLIDSDGKHGVSLASRVDRSMWEGFSLPKDLGCDCRRGKPHHTPEYQKCPIVKWACEKPTGSASYLQTNFTRPFRICNDRLHSALGSQEVLPHLLPVPAIQWEDLKSDDAQECLYGCYEDDSISVRIKPIGNDSARKQGSSDADSVEKLLTSDYLRLALLKLDMAGDGSLHAVIGFNSSKTPGSKGFYFAYKELNSTTIQHQYHEIPAGQTGNAMIVLQAAAVESRVIEYGVYCQALSRTQSTDPVLTISSLCIKPIQHIGFEFDIGNVQITQRERGAVAETWLTWEWQGSAAGWPETMPWSSTTGPFSSFHIIIDGKEVGKAHCLQFPLRKEDLEEAEGEEVTVTIIGQVFGDRSFRSTSTVISRSELCLGMVGSEWCLLHETFEGGSTN